MRKLFKWLFALAGVWLALWAGDRVWAGRGLAAAEPERFSADLAVRQGRLVDGQSEIQWYAPKKLRIERERGPRAWKTTLTMLDESPLSGRPADTDIVGIFDSGEDEPLLTIDRAGRRRSIDDTPGLGRLLGGTTALRRDVAGRANRRQRSADAWMDAFVVTPAARERRARAVASGMGQPRGRVRGLDRYVSTDGRVTREVLLDPSSLVPLEVNEAIDGKLDARTTMAYQADARGTMTRTSTRLEQHGTPSLTAIVDIQYSNIRLPKGGVS